MSMSLLVEVTIDGSEVDSPNVARKGSNDTATGCFVFFVCKPIDYPVY